MPDIQQKRQMKGMKTEAEAELLCIKICFGNWNPEVIWDSLTLPGADSPLLHSHPRCHPALLSPNLIALQLLARKKSVITSD